MQTHYINTLHLEQITISQPVCNGACISTIYKWQIAGQICVITVLTQNVAHEMDCYGGRSLRGYCDAMEVREYWHL